MKEMAMGLILLCLAALPGCGLDTEGRRDEFYAKGVAALAAGKVDDARLEAQNVLRIDPKFAKGHALMGDIAMARKEWQTAFSSYSKAVELDPELNEADKGLAKLFFMAGQFDKTREKTAKVLARNAGDFEMRLIDTLILVREDKGQEALPVLEKLATERPDVEDVPVAIADIHVNAGRIEDAVAALTKGLAATPDSLLLHTRLGALLLGQKRFDEAEVHFKRVAEIAPDNDGAQLMLVRFYLDSNQKPKAVSRLDTLVGSFPQKDAYRLGLAQMRVAEGDVDGAVAVLQKGIAELTETHGLRLALADLLAGQRRFDQAEQELNKAIELGADHPKVVDVRLALAKVYGVQGKSDLADQQIEEVLKRDPQNLEGLSLKGRRALQQAKAQDAILYFRQALKLDPGQLDLVPLLARAHLANNEPLLARDVLKETLKTNSGHVPTRTMLAELYVLDNDLSAAVAELQALTAIVPDDLGVVFGLSDLALRMNDPARAEAILLQAQQDHPQRAEVHLRMARFHVDSGPREQAVKDLDRAAEIAPTSLEVTEFRVNLLLLDKRYKDALAFCDSLLAEHPESAYLHDLKGRIYSASGDFAKAESSFTKAIEIDSGWLAGYYRLAELYLKKGEIDVGIAKFEDALARQPEAIRPRFALALLNQMNSRPQDARRHYEAILAQDSSFFPAVNNLAYLLAEEFPDPADLEKALALAKQASESGTAEGLDTLGWVYFRMNDHDKAVATFLEAWDKKAELPVLAYHLAETYRAKGDLDQARTWIRKAVNATEDFPERDQAQKLAQELGAPKE